MVQPRSPLADHQGRVVLRGAAVGGGMAAIAGGGGEAHRRSMAAMGVRTLDAHSWLHQLPTPEDETGWLDLPE